MQFYCIQRIFYGGLIKSNKVGLGELASYALAMAVAAIAVTGIDRAGHDRPFGLLRDHGEQLEPGP